MRSFSTVVFIVVLCGLSHVVPLASAETVLFQDDYETPLPGTALCDYTPPVGISYVSTATLVVADANTMSTPGATADGQFAGPTAYASAAFLNFNSAPTTNNVVRFHFDSYMDSTAVDFVAFGTFTDSSYGGRGWYFLVNPTGAVSYYDGSSWVPVAGTAATDEWISIDVEADYSTCQYTATVDDVSWTTGFATSAHSAGMMYVSPTDKSYFDSVSITAVPEPSALLVLATGLLGLLAYAWRKRK